MKGVLLLTNELNYDDKMCEYAVTCYDFGLSLYIDDEYTLGKQLNNQNLIIDGLKDGIDSMLMGENHEEAYKYKKLIDNLDDFYNYIEYIAFTYDVDIIKFINDNPIVKNKKIVLPGIIQINDYDKVKDLLNQYDEYKDNIYVSMDNNMTYVSLSDCFNSISMIKHQADEILALNLSPVEMIMYSYDIVRNRVYKDENEDDDKYISRDLNNVLTGDKIVCVGFSNHFSALLHYIGIKCYKTGTTLKDDPDESGHERNIIYIKDDKYNIDGVYYFDTTWDSKRKNETNQFLNKYRFFAKTRREMIELENDLYIYDDSPYFSDNLIEETKTALEENDIGSLAYKYVKTINFMSRIVNEKLLINIGDLVVNRLNNDINNNEINKIINNLQIINDKFNKPIPAETYIKLINNVRKLEYYKDSDFYPYTLDDLYRIYLNSNWKFSKNYYSDQERLLLAIFGKTKDENRNDKREDFINYTRSEDINRDIKEVRLTKILQKTYNNKIKD